MTELRWTRFADALPESGKAIYCFHEEFYEVDLFSQQERKERYSNDYLKDNYTLWAYVPMPAMPKQEKECEHDLKMNAFLLEESCTKCNYKRNLITECWNEIREKIDKEIEEAIKNAEASKLEKECAHEWHDHDHHFECIKCKIVHKKKLDLSMSDLTDFVCEISKRVEKLEETFRHNCNEVAPDCTERKPKVGDIVLFYRYENPLPSIIKRIIENHDVSLVIFDTQGSDYIGYVQYSKEPKPGHWSWRE